MACCYMHFYDSGSKTPLSFGVKLRNTCKGGQTRPITHDYFTHGAPPFFQLYSV
jgi:hypothetical protein